MKQLDDKFENDQFSDGSDQEQEHAQRHINERVDGFAEYQSNIPLSIIRYNIYMKALKSMSATSKYKQVIRELQMQLRQDPDWRNDQKSEYDIQKFFDSSLLRD